MILNKKNGLSERIRTSGLVNPIHARYQTVLHPDIEDYYSGFYEKFQEEISIFNKKIRKVSKKAENCDFMTLLSLCFTF